MSLANKVTLARLFLTVAYLFLLYEVTLSSMIPAKTITWSIIFALFLIIAILDIVDGYLARVYKEVSSFGRMLDPFVDKIFIISSYIIFGSYGDTKDIIPLWLVLIVMFRELLVQGIRHYCEGRNIEFGANFLGKRKMLLQSLVLGGLILYVIYFKKWSIFTQLLKILVYLMVVTTIFSGLIYTLTLVRTLSKGEVLKS
ncbi:MAG: CDP-diacylglycerol--glycerol-3-phosphate 3-phosphatidyltransferase [Planctomycetota bacterium]